MRKIWKTKSFSTETQKKLCGHFHISPVLSTVLINRRLTDLSEVREFLYGDLSGCHDPFKMKDMDKAVDRINTAISKKERVLIYGDYDVDGITSAALLVTVLKDLGANVASYIPNRLEDGYGLSMNGIDQARKQKAKLIITVDCGISSLEEVSAANGMGIDVVITDHHEIKSEEIPNAYAVINPHRPDCDYPFKSLAGVGVAYKLADALTRGGSYDIEKHLDLVALGTVADVVPQRSENRIFTKHGLTRINGTDKIGLSALIKICGIKNGVGASHIGFGLGPRINAMGRIGKPEVALRLLLTEDRIEAEKLANQLNAENKNRQKIEAGILEEALLKVEREINFSVNKVIVLSHEGWHPGVIGIVASRLQERFYRPAIVISLTEGKGKGSGRSIPGFHLFEALKSTSDHLLDFGGHQAACGLSIDKAKISGFFEKLNEYADKHILDDDLLPKLTVDCDMPLSSVTRDLISELDLLKPYGPGNAKPVFSTHGLVMKNNPRLLPKNGFKMWLNDNGTACEAISFKRDSIDVPSKGQKLDIAYSPSINKWQGIESIQLDIKDIKLGDFTQKVKNG